MLKFAVPLLSLAVFSSGFAKKEFKLEKDKVSHILGHQIGSNFKRSGVDINTTEFVAALKDALAGKPSSISPEDSQKTMATFQESVQKKMEAKRKEQGSANGEIGKKYLAENAKKPGVVTLLSGLQYKILKDGAGASPKSTDTVTTNYEGKLISGTVFDSSYKRKEPASFPVGGVIKGWTEALQLMKPGSKWELTVPANLAYGEQGAGADIGPNSVLIFEVELLSIAAPTPSPSPAAPAK